jgi:hypothetical protein
MQQVGMNMTHKLVGTRHPQRLQMVEGTHLFPMERPAQTAAVIADTLQALNT